MSGQYFARFHAELWGEDGPETRAYNSGWTALRPVYARTQSERVLIAANWADEQRARRFQVFALSGPVKADAELVNPRGATLTERWCIMA